MVFFHLAEKDYGLSYTYHGQLSSLLVYEPNPKFCSICTKKGPSAIIYHFKAKPVGILEMPDSI
jgi:hypothetical protein